MINIQAKPYKLAFAHAYNWAKGVEQVRQGLIIRAEINGSTGWGEIAPPLNSVFNKDFLLKKCNSIINATELNTNNYLLIMDQAKLEPCIRYGISAAILSAQANMENQSLSQYLGNKQPPDKIPVNFLAAGANLSSFKENLRTAINNGQNTIKIKCSQDNNAMFEKLEIVKGKYPDIKIRLDPNQSWSEKNSLYILKQLTKFNIDYIEDPLPETSTIQEYAELINKTNIPIAIDEPLTSIQLAKKVIQYRAANVLILKPQRIGGIDRITEIIDLARSANIRSVITSSIETSVGIQLGLHCAAYLQDKLEPCGLGTSNFFSSNITEPHKIHNGYIEICHKPGLGLDPQPWWDGAS